jgi:hypothetical protein
MSQIYTDKYGFAVTMNTVGSDDIYTRDGVMIVAPTGTDSISVIESFNGMMPNGYVMPPVPTPTKLSALDFIRRFTAAERVTLVASDPVWGVMIAAAGQIDTTSVELMTDLQAAVSAGLLTQARMVQVLNLAVTSP